MPPVDAHPSSTASSTPNRSVTTGPTGPPRGAPTCPVAVAAVPTWPTWPPSCSSSSTTCPTSPEPTCPLTSNPTSPTHSAAPLQVQMAPAVHTGVLTHTTPLRRRRRGLLPLLVPMPMPVGARRQLAEVESPACSMRCLRRWLVRPGRLVDRQGGSGGRVPGATWGRGIGRLLAGSCHHQGVLPAFLCCAVWRARQDVVDGWM
mmetsp:Transcript_38420/g.109820  ORF Transcript_38420/g.109820 Transcript_38420/m.109820 type:complete len:203 (-) Transcript_38420:271-879(-)